MWMFEWIVVVSLHLDVIFCAYFVCYLNHSIESVIWSRCFFFSFANPNIRILIYTTTTTTKIHAYNSDNNHRNDLGILISQQKVPNMRENEKYRKT